MPGRHKTADQLKEAVVLRAGGYSIAAISVKTGISASTLERHFSKHRVKKGAVSDDLIEQAKQELLNDAGFIDSIKTLIASSVVDDLAHVAQLRTAMTLTLEQLMADTDLPAHYKTRGIAAIATSLVLSQKAARIALAADNQPVESEDLPELTIAELTNEDIESIHREQRAAGALIDDDDRIIEGECE